MDNWQNVDAGPRQVKDLKQAIGELAREAKTRDELTGVVGGDEHRFTTWQPFGIARPEVTALDEAIRVKHSYRVTRENVREIIADYAAALPEACKSRQTDDNRRTDAEDAELKAASAARDAEYQAKRDAESAVMAQVMGKRPAAAKGLIIAEWHEDASDPMTDYFASHTRRTVAIGWRYSSREDFRALRAAAAGFAETAGLAEGMTEHRDNHSMGAGNYLSDHGWAGSGTGWLIKSRDIPCSWVNLTEDAIPVPVNGIRRPQPGDGAVTVTPSSIGRDGVVEVHFADRPGEDVLAGLKAHGFRWARGNRCWYGSDVAYAESLAAV